MTKAEICKRIRQNLDYLQAEYSVKSIALFGSYSQDQGRAGSDIDLLIEFDQPIGFRFIELAEYLEGLLGSPVDILTPAGVKDIRIPHIAESIQGSLVYV